MQLKGGVHQVPGTAYVLKPLVGGSRKGLMEKGTSVDHERFCSWVVLRLLICFVNFPIVPTALFTFARLQIHLHLSAKKAVKVERGSRGLVHKAFIFLSCRVCPFMASVPPN